MYQLLHGPEVNLPDFPDVWLSPCWFCWLDSVSAFVVDSVDGSLVASVDSLLCELGLSKFLGWHDVTEGIFIVNSLSWQLQVMFLSQNMRHLYH